MSPAGRTNSSGLAFWRRPIGQQILLVAIASLVFFTGLGRVRLMDRDEPRNAGCAAEMLARGDWVVPVFNAELRTHKPVLTYWFMMAGYAVFGVNEFGARFWSAVLGIGTILMTYHIGRRLFNATVGFWAGLVTCTALWFAIASRIATPDSVLVFFSTLPVLIYVLAAVKPKKDPDPDAVEETRWRDAAAPFPRGWWMAAGVYAAMGMAILAKGPVGIVLPTAVLGMFLLIVRRDAEREAGGSATAGWGFLRVFSPLHLVKTGWSMRPVTAVAVSLAVSLPWYILVHQRTDGEWTRGFFLEHNLGRATGAMEGHGGGGLLYLLYFLYYPVVTMVAFLPWSVFLIEAVIEAWRRISRRDPWRLGYLLAACWVGVYLVAFTLAATKLPSYVTPMYPALGLLVAAYLYQLFQSRQLTSGRAPARIFGIVIALGVGAAIATPIIARTLLPGSGWLGVVGAIPIVGGTVCLMLYLKGKRRQAARAFAVASTILTTVILGGVLRYVDGRYQKSDELLTAIRESNAHPTIISYGVLEPSWVFYARQPIKEHYDDPGPVIEKLRNAATYLITPVDSYEAMARKLPGGVVVLARIPRYLRPDKPDLVAVGRPR